jgi:hypothetical protein
MQWELKVPSVWSSRIDYSPEIKQLIGYHEIRQFSVLINKCRIYEKDSRVRSAHYKSVSDKKGKNLDRDKTYGILAYKGK